MHNVILAFLLTLTLPVFALAQQSSASNRFERVLNLAPPDSAKSVFSVSGTVVSAVTGEPVESALVRLELTRQAAVLAALQENVVAGIEPVLTDRDGRFEFVRVAEGPYNLGVSKRRYWPLEYAQNANGTPLFVRAAARLDQILVRLFPAASIEGRLTDTAPGLGIELFEMNQIPVKWMGETTSAADGSYYFDGLKPGRYVVQSRSSDNDVSMTAFANATTIPTEETRTLDFSLFASKGYTISGQFVATDGFQDGVVRWHLDITRMSSPARRIAREIRDAIRPGDSSADQRTQSFDRPVFAVEGLSPGLYRLEARGESIASGAICGVVELLVSNTAVAAVRIPMSNCAVVEVIAR